MLFLDRADAGRRLAAALAGYAGTSCVVYALPRGGVAVGVEIAHRLRAPLDLIVARKIGHPRCPEYAIGAVTASGGLVVNAAEVARLDPKWFQGEVARQTAEAQRRREVYAGPEPSPDVEGRTAILVDDGLATGLTMKAAIDAVKQRHPGAIVVAVPVAPAETLKSLAGSVDRVVCLQTPIVFEAIGEFYENFEQVEDATVTALLRAAARDRRGAARDEHANAD